MRRSCNFSFRRPSSISISSRSALLRQLCLEELLRESREKREPPLTRLMSEQDRADLQGDGVIRASLPRQEDEVRGDETSNLGAASRGARRAERAERAEQVERAERGEGRAELPPEEALEGLADASRRERHQETSASRGSAERPRAVLRGRQEVCKRGPRGTVNSGWRLRLEERPLRKEEVHSAPGSTSMSESSEHAPTLRREQLRLNSWGTVAFAGSLVYTDGL